MLFFGRDISFSRNEDSKNVHWRGLDKRLAECGPFCCLLKSQPVNKYWDWRLFIFNAHQIGKRQQLEGPAQALILRMMGN
jgi:hypothetical protein